MNGRFAQQLRQLLPALWLGELLTVALVATPAPFALLARPDAGRVVGRILAQEAWVALVAGGLLLVLERARIRQAADSGAVPPAWSAELWLLLGAVFCTVAGYFGLQPAMGSARLGQGPLSFGQLHAVSAGFFAIKLLLVAALAWRSASVWRAPQATQA